MKWKDHYYAQTRERWLDDLRSLEDEIWRCISTINEIPKDDSKSEEHRGCLKYAQAARDSLEQYIKNMDAVWAFAYNWTHSRDPSFGSAIEDMPPWMKNLEICLSENRVLIPVKHRITPEGSDDT